MPRSSYSFPLEVFTLDTPLLTTPTQRNVTVGRNRDVACGNAYHVRAVGGNPRNGTRAERQQFQRSGRGQAAWSAIRASRCHRAGSGERSFWFLLLLRHDLPLDVSNEGSGNAVW